MKKLEDLAKKLNAGTISFERVFASYSEDKLSAQQSAATLAGLKPIEESLIWCKYFQDGKSCKKAMSQFITSVNNNPECLRWVKYSEHDEKISQHYSETVIERAAASPVLTYLAFDELIKLRRCPACMGAGLLGYESFADRKCDWCHGTGSLSNKMTAQKRANHLQVSLSTYWRKFDTPYKNYYWNLVVRQETQALIKISEQWA